MSDQMPDEVWVDEHDVAWNAGDGLIPGDAIRYIRADLYEQVEAERDRLRAALERAREMAEDGKTSACAMQVCEDIELIAQEALSHG